MSKSVNRIDRSGWQKHISAWLKSDLTQAEYCHRHGLNERYFSLWKRRLLCERHCIFSNFLQYCALISR